MDITRVEDLNTLQQLHATRAAAYDHDFVALLADPIEELIPTLTREEEAGELTLLFVGAQQGLPVSTVRLSIPTLDNLTSVNLEITVHPSHRRLGFGRAALQFGIDESRRRGRNRIFMEVPSREDGSDGPAVPLMKEVGARAVLEDYRRLLDLRRDALAEPTAVPAAYRLVQWLDRAPDEIVDGAAYLMSRMSVDAPMGDMDYEQEKWDAARYRASEEAAMSRSRIRVATAVVHVESGALAGITDIGINLSRPEIAYQWETIVDPDHRGHGLGMVLKSWNHQQLVQHVPQASFINTWNAASNTFMIAVNDALGFQPVERWTEYQLDLAP